MTMSGGRMARDPGRLGGPIFDLETIDVTESVVVGHQDRICIQRVGGNEQIKRRKCLAPALQWQPVRPRNASRWHDPKAVQSTRLRNSRTAA